MKKLQKLHLKKIKIANINYIASLTGGETEACMSTVCNTDICDTAPLETQDGICSTTLTSNTTLHTRADTVTCMNGGNTANQFSVVIC